jgi:hypothetical protein
MILVLWGSVKSSVKTGPHEPCKKTVILKTSPRLRMAERPAMRLLDACVGAWGAPSGRTFVIMKVVFFPAPINERPPKSLTSAAPRIRP